MNYDEGYLHEKRRSCRVLIGLFIRTLIHRVYQVQGRFIPQANPFIILQLSRYGIEDYT